MSENPRIGWQRAASDLFAQFFALPRTSDSDDLKIHQATNTSRLLAMFIIASVPAAIIGTWQVGVIELSELASVPAQSVGWRQALLSAGGIDNLANGPVKALVTGLTFVLPLILVAMLAAASWEIIFATIRKKTIDPGWAMTSWLFVLLLPPKIPLALAAIGISFGTVLGKHVFGGTGHYIASPALIGAVFMTYAYPTFGAETTTWQIVADVGLQGAAIQGISWSSVFFGNEIGLLGTGSALACTLGAIWLAVTGAASWRTLLGALLGLTLATAIATLLGDTIPAYWHFALGSAAFCWAFILTDPTTLPVTVTGRWLHGGLFGLLLVLIREADPTHPEASLVAVLLASLFIPVIDFAVLRAQARRSGNQLEIKR